MGLFGIKKVTEDNKPSNTFINDSVINAQDYNNMPNNAIIGYNNPTIDNNNELNIINVDSSVNGPETFVYTQVDNNNYNNQFVNNTNQPTNDVFQSIEVDNSTMQQSDDIAQTTPEVPTSEPELPQLNQELNTSETNINFDNSALFALPAGAIVEEIDVLEEPEPEIKESPIEEAAPQYDPLDNANNPIPVNPVADDPLPDDDLFFDEEAEEKINLFTIINMMIGIIIKPASTILENIKKYTKFSRALLLSFWIGIFSFVLCLIGRIIAGCFSTTHNAITGASKITIDFSGLVDTANYIPYLLVTFLISIVGIIVVAMVYYFSSFVNSKGVHIGVYFANSALSMVPIILGFTILHPLISILSSSIAMLILIFSTIYSFIILFTGINSVLKFNTNDGPIIYNSINIAIILSIMVVIFEILSNLNILELTFLFS